MSWLRFGPDHRELITTLAAWLHKTRSRAPWQCQNFMKQKSVKMQHDTDTTWFVRTVLMAKVSLSEAEGSLGHAQVQHQLAQRALDAGRNFSFGMWLDILWYLPFQCSLVMHGYAARRMPHELLYKAWVWEVFAVLVSTNYILVACSHLLGAVPDLQV